MQFHTFAQPGPQPAMGVHDARCSTYSTESAIEIVPVDSEGVSRQNTQAASRASTSAVWRERCLDEPKIEARRNAVVVMDSEAESCFDSELVPVAPTFAELKVKFTKMVQCKASWAETCSTSDAFLPVDQCTEAKLIATGFMEKEAKSRHEPPSVSSKPPSLREILAKMVQCRSSLTEKYSTSHRTFSADERSQALSAPYTELGRMKPENLDWEANGQHERQSTSTKAPSSRQSVYTTDSF